MCKKKNEREIGNMIEMKVDSVRINLATQSRIVILKTVHTNQYLFIWIAPAEAYAIAVSLQKDHTTSSRPLTHDLITEVITQMNAKIITAIITDLIDEVFYANLVLDVGGRHIRVDSRPSDAIAIALRSDTPIYVMESVLEKAGVEFDQNEEIDQNEETDQNEEKENLNAYRDFINNLDALDDFGKEK